MPKPLLFTRKTGLYVRFFVPTDLHRRLGRRFIVRSLHGAQHDAARLMAASLESALSHAFARLRQDEGLDAERIVDDAILNVRGGRDPIINTPHGTSLSHHDAAMEDRLVRAIIAALTQAGVIPSPDTRAPPAPPVELLSGRMEAFLSHMKIQGRSETNLLDTSFTLRLFLGVVGDKDLSRVGPSDLDMFIDALGRWPAHASKKPAYRGLSPNEVLSKATRRRDKTLSPRTREKHLDRLRFFFNNCVQRRLLTYNPCAGIQITNKEQDDQETRQPFSEKDLRFIFESRRFISTVPFKYWGPILALYSGMRLNEIGQLQTDDVERIDGIWGVHVRHQIKNKHSRRFVPLHPALLSLGFVEYVHEVQDHGFIAVFPGLKAGIHGPGDAIGDWFNRTYLRKTCHLTDPMKTFHSFRHTFASLAERSSLSDHRIARLTGHSTGASILRRHYIQPATLQERAADIAKIQFPSLDVPVPLRGDFEPYFQRVRALEARHERNKVKSRDIHR